jgi:hypothetical protein
MNIWLITSDTKRVSRLDALFNIAGVVISAEDFKQTELTYEELINRFLNFGRYKLALPLPGNTSDDLVKQSEYLSSISDRIIIQLPLTLEGLIAAKSLYKKGIPMMNMRSSNPDHYISTLLANFDYFYTDVDELKDINIVSGGPIILSKGTIADQLALHTDFELVLDVGTVDDLVAKESIDSHIMQSIDSRRVEFIERASKPCCQKKKD